jgi:hypothetical protein
MNESDIVIDEKNNFFGKKTSNLDADKNNEK